MKNAPLFSPCSAAGGGGLPFSTSGTGEKGGAFFTRDCSWLALSFLFKSKLIQFI